MKNVKSSRFLACALMFIFASATNSIAQTTETHSVEQDSVVHTVSLYFRVGKTVQIDSLNHQAMGDFVSEARKYNQLPITIMGWADKSGKKDFNCI